MLLSTPCATTSTTLMCVGILISCLIVVQAQQHGSPPPSDNSSTGVICRPFGLCEPCPDAALHEPFCQPFGNRRLMHCSPRSEVPAAAHNPNSPSQDVNTAHNAGANRPFPMHHNPDPPQGETPAWESCGRIVERERADFWEFVACNVVFAAISLFVVFARSKRLEALHARQLAARIGLLRNHGGE